VTRRLRDIGEHGWIARLLRTVPSGPDVVVGPGDDAAAIRSPAGTVLLTTDTLVEGTHFHLGWERPARLGQRALRINLSDVAAMGGRPLAALVGVEAPPGLPVAVLNGLMRGMIADARGHGVDVVGGNLAAAPRLAIGVTVVGEARGRPVTRAGACAGDDVWVTGTLGGAGAAVRELLAGRPARRPPVPVRLGAARLLGPLAHAMIDVSDGLVQDLGHVCRASGVAAEVEGARVPVAVACRRLLGASALAFAATAGEDYELLLAAPPRHRRRLERLAPRLDCALTRVGWIVAGPPRVRLCDPAGRPLGLRRAGFDHFRPC
jgi:thiamine-monophosphate kinase